MQAQRHVSTRDSQIVDVRYWTVREPSSRRAWSIIALRSAAGLAGYGECAGPIDREAAERLPALKGRDATAYVGASVHGAVDGAINAAMLDLAAKAAKTPLYRFLGGPTRFKLRIMQDLPGDTDESLIRAMQSSAEQGCRAFGVPLPRVHARNQGQDFVRAVVRRLESLRKSGGDNFDFALLGEGVLSPGDAASVAAAVEPFHLLWFDEPCSISNLQALRKIADETVTPVGFGKSITTPSMYQDLLRDGLANIVRPAIHTLGITDGRRIAALAETYYAAVAPRHSPGPVGVAASTQYAASIANFFIHEYPNVERRDSDFRRGIVSTNSEKVEEGFVPLPTSPGLGVQVDESALDRLAVERSPQ